MKIEKINDNSIKCTLSQQDLTDRELRLSELAYGSDKAKALFSELLLQASYECGFDAQDAPLMIEAVPMSKDSLVLILTKVTDPEELNVNYSNISMPTKKSLSEKNPALFSGSRADEIIKESESIITNPLDKFKEFLESASKDGKFNLSISEHEEKDKLENITRAYTFDSLDWLIRLAGLVAPFYDGENILYKNPETEQYCLFLTMRNSNPEEFNKVCNICAEYGEQLHTKQVSRVYFDEHFRVIIRSRALQKLKLLYKR